MKKVFDRFAVLTLLAVMSLAIVSPVFAGPDVKDLNETSLVNSSSSPFHLNTDRFNNAFQSISGYLTSHDELSASSILIADNHGHLLRGVVSDWTYYTYGTHKGIELYVFNPEDGSQFLTVEVWLPKEQQRNMDKRDSYLSSFQQIESLLSGSAKYRLDLVFQDEVPLAWGKGYSFKLDDESTSLSFAFMNGSHPKAKSREVKEVKEKPAATPVVTPMVKASATAQVTASVTASTTPTTTHKKKKKSTKTVAAEPTAVPTATAADAAPTASDSAR